MSGNRVRKELAAGALAALLIALPAAAQQHPGRTIPAESQPLGARPDLARFRARADAVLAEAKALKSYWGVLVVDAATGETLYELNGDRYFQPASNAKLFTTALAMARLGPGYRFHTTLETSGTLDRGGVLRGDLVLVGRGALDLSNRKYPYRDKAETDGPPEKALAELADAVVAKGVKEIEGDVVADDSYFDYERYPPGWEVDDIPFGFGAAVSAIAVNDNTLTAEVQPATRSGAPAIFTIELWPGFYAFDNRITTGAPGSETRLDLSWEPGSRNIVLSGSLPLGAKAMRLEFAIQEPAEYAAALLKRLLEQHGVRISGRARAKHAPARAAAEGATVLAERLSPPLLEIIRVVNKLSQNLHAELLLRTVAKVETGIGSREAGLKDESDFLKGIGVEEDDVLLNDGSGLSRANLVTPRAVVALLRYAAHQPWGEDFFSTLPVAGKDGTLESRMKDTPAAGRVRAKTGSLEHVRATSGLVTTRAGAHLIFSMFDNNSRLHGKDSVAVFDALCDAMVEEIGAAPVKTP
jgi:D-alanyl-D-alanine carboxypeptidase/D-alanyl-D-alanine-endopeptidase (penicillin-binding protein 4)